MFESTDQQVLARVILLGLGPAYEEVANPVAVASIKSCSFITYVRLSQTKGRKSFSCSCPFVCFLISTTAAVGAAARAQLPNRQRSVCSSCKRGRATIFVFFCSIDFKRSRKTIERSINGALAVLPHLTGSPT